MENFEQYLIENFKWFHRHPEMPYEEVQTTAKIRELLKSYPNVVCITSKKAFRALYT